MIYTLEAAAKRCEVEIINIMEFVFLGMLDIYSVESKQGSEAIDGVIGGFKPINIGLAKWNKELTQMVANDYVNGGGIRLEAYLSKDTFDRIRFLDSDLKKIINENIRVPISDDEYKLSPPKNSGKWNECIYEALRDFYNVTGYPATTTDEVIQRLINKSPQGYTVKPIGEGYSVNGGSPTIRANLSKLIKGQIKKAILT